MNKEIYANKRITYNNLVSVLQKNGNRSAAEHIARGCVARIKIKEEKDSISLFDCCARRAKPLIAGVPATNHQKKTKIVPIPSNRGRRLAIQWIIQGARKKKGLERGMEQCIYLEMLSVRSKRGYAIKKNEEMLLSVLGGKAKN